jgi:hypothetical protein
MSLHGSQWFKSLKNLEIIQGENELLFSRSKLYEGAVFLDGLCAKLTNELVAADAHLSTIDRVAGGLNSSIFAHDLARQIGKARSLPCLSAHLVSNGEFKIKLNTKLKETERTLLCIDVLDEPDAVNDLFGAVIDAGGLVVPYVATIWNATESVELYELNIVSLIKSKDSITYI